MSRILTLPQAEQIDLLTGESLLYGLLGRLLYQEPNHAWISSLYQENIFREAPFGMQQPHVRQGLAHLRDWGTLEDGLIPEPLFKDLESDYLRLFVGLGKVLAPPWESVHFSPERLVFQEETLQVRGWYRRYGLEVEKLHREPDDHIGLQLSFVAHLAAEASTAAEAADVDLLDELLQAQGDFLNGHLFRWESAWYELVLEHTRTDFYRGAAELTHGALRATAEMLEISRPLEIIE